MIYRDRLEAGRFLAGKLTRYADQPEVIVLGLPRGGVPVAYEVARALHAPLDVFAVRKLGMPGQEEFAIGAVASGGVMVLNSQIVRALNLSELQIEQLAAKERAELERREHEYRGDRPPLELSGATAILVDDGLATGASMWAAVTALRRHKPARIIAAVPVGSFATCARFEEVTDETICARAPIPFNAVGNWYLDFSQTTDEEVRELLARAETEREGPLLTSTKPESDTSSPYLN